jgi:hypothetical protein
MPGRDVFKMKLYELKNDIRDTSIIRDILDLSRICQRLALYIEFIEEINHDDFDYISITTNKAKTMLCTVHYILESYIKEIQKSKQI